MNNLKACARGSWQYNIVCDLIQYDSIINPCGKPLAGKAKSYAGKYQTSFYNLLKRLRAAGAVIEYIPGVRGGAYTARYKLIRG